MKVKSKKPDLAEGDLTPMIDMTFQLIAFFMVLINFTQTESNDRVKLPNSQLVKPPDKPEEFPIVLHVAADGEIILSGDTYTVETLSTGLRGEKSVMVTRDVELPDVKVIIRGHKNVAAGQVQDIIKACQDEKFEKFALRAKEDRS